MKNIYENIASINSRSVEDKEGFIRAVLKDVKTDFDYDRWMTLVGILKYEIEDEEVAFNIFDEFSSQFDSYDSEEVKVKFFNSGIKGDGSAKLGSLIHWMSEEIPNFKISDYDKFCSKEKVSAVKKLRERLEKSENSLPDHILTEEVQQLKLPDISVPAEMALSILLQPGFKYSTVTDPRRDSKQVDPYKGEELEQYISVNPMTGSRKQANCALFRHAVLEFDTISLDEQFSIFNAVDLPYEALVFTGNKSIHAWVRIDAPDLDSYKNRTRLINKMFEDFGYNKKNGNKLDTKVLYDPSSWVRCPGVIRTSIKEGDNSTGNLQKVIWCEESEGWDFWYSKVYPNYVIESSLSAVPREFEVPEKDLKFSRKLKQVIDGLEGEDFLEEFKSIFKGMENDDVEETLNEAVTSFLQHIRKKAKIRVTLDQSDLYHIFESTVLEAGTLYEGDVREALLNSCRIAEHFEAERKRQYKERLEEEVDSIKGKINKWVDPELVQEIDKSLAYSKDQGEQEYSEVLKSVEELFEDLDFRTAVLKKPELYKYAGLAGELLSAEFKEQKAQDSDDIFYVYYDELQTFDREGSKFEKVNTYNFPSVVTPYICFVQKDNKGKFKAVPLDDNSVAKLLSSYQFLSSFKKVDVISKVPVFNEEDGEVSLIKGYHPGRKILVVGNRDDYEFMELERAKEIILDLFVDFKFVSPADLSRAIACLFMPAMCHAGLLRNDFRPLSYIDADSEGAGKGTMIYFLTCPYVDSYGLVTQDDASIGSIDEKIASCIKDGNNHVVLDNLKPTRKMKELSSSFIEAMMTADKISFRCAGERMSELDLRWANLYVTTNGMKLSRDTADRSLYISIRKQDPGYKYRQYENGLKNWLIERRPEIMSAIFTILKEYVEHGKPLAKVKEKHRFLYSVPAVNYIVTEIFGLPDVTSGIGIRNSQKSSKGIEVIRNICFCVDKDGLLGAKLTHLDMFEILAKHSKDDILDLGYNTEIYTDESGEIITSDAKRKIGTKLGILFSNPLLLGKQSKTETKECYIEEFTIKRYYEKKSKTPYYEIAKEVFND